MRVASEIDQERGEIATVFYEALLFDFGIRPPMGLSRSCLLFIIIAGLIHADKNNFTPFMPFGPCGVFKSSVVLFFAYTGFDVVSTMAEKTKNPGWGKYMVAAGDLKGILYNIANMVLSNCWDNMNFRVKSKDPKASMDKDSFIRFAIWTVLILIYYAFLGLHASYEEIQKNAEWDKVEEVNTNYEFDDSVNSKNEHLASSK
ncbi:hypothetical protein KY289_013512 [Solanum tuberosum]|nr:hypothetical protein KY289_013512 [Solanum tuberosum]